MMYEIKKIAKIVDEVMTYFMFNYNCEALIEVKRSDHTAIMKFKFEPVRMENDEFEKLQKRFCSVRQPELESYYWQLAGETEEDNEISLVAMMCDNCEMKLSGTVLEMELIRKK